MPRLFLGNFDFEEQLAGESQELPEVMQRLNAEMAAGWAGVAEDGDFIWCPEPSPPEFWEGLRQAGCAAVQPVSRAEDVPPGLELVPWGWSDEVRQWAAAVGAVVNAPPDSAVRTGNSRQFSYDCEVEWGLALPGETAVTAFEDVAAAVQAVGADGQRWVVKARFSHAARERVLGRGTSVDAATVNWIRRRIDRDGVVFLEPWLDRIEEVGIQWTVPPQGPAVCDAITPLLTDEFGRYCGSRFATNEPLFERWASALEIGRRLAERLQALGYFGPVGIDAMRYRDTDGAERIRPLQDVNARWTMGRMALGFVRFLRAGEQGCWRHSSRRDASPTPSARVIPTAPDLLSRRPVVHRTFVEIT